METTVPTVTDSTILCKNCDTAFQGQYCPECGQKSSVARVTLKHVFTELRQHFINFDQGFLFTIKQLMLRPGHAIREYLEGKRVHFIKPVRFVFWMTTINFLLFHYLQLDRWMMENIAKDRSEKQRQFTEGFMQYLFDHPVLVQVIMIPSVAFFSWLFARKRGYNYAEHLVLSAYVMAGLSFLGLFNGPLFLLFKDVVPLGWYTLTSMFLWVGYQAWTYQQFFKFRQWYTGILRSLLVVFCGYFGLIVFTTIITVIYLIVVNAPAQGQ